MTWSVLGVLYILAVVGAIIALAGATLIGWTVAAVNDRWGATLACTVLCALTFVVVPALIVGVVWLEGLVTA